MKMNKTGIFLIVFFLILATAFVTYSLKFAKEPELLPVISANNGHHVQPFSFTNQEGETITNEDVQGKIYVVEYFFTTCKGICPKMNENMSKVYEAFRGNNMVKILSHSVD